MQNDTSEIRVHRDGGVTLSGPDAMELYRVLTIKQGLELYAKTGMFLTRGATPRKLLDMATGYSGKKYANSPKGREMAVADLRARIAALKASIPTTQG